MSVERENGGEVLDGFGDAFVLSGGHVDTFRKPVEDSGYDFVELMDLVGVGYEYEVVDGEATEKIERVSLPVGFLETVLSTDLDKRYLGIRNGVVSGMLQELKNRFSPIMAYYQLVSSAEEQEQIESMVALTGMLRCSKVIWESLECLLLVEDDLTRCAAARAEKLMNGSQWFSPSIKRQVRSVDFVRRLVGSNHRLVITEEEESKVVGDLAKEVLETEFYGEDEDENEFNKGVLLDFFARHLVDETSFLYPLVRESVSVWYELGGEIDGEVEDLSDVDGMDFLVLFVKLRDMVVSCQSSSEAVLKLIGDNPSLCLSLWDEDDGEEIVESLRGIAGSGLRFEVR